MLSRHSTDVVANEHDPADLGARTAELCCVLDCCGNQHYPPSWVEASTLAGTSGFWVGHSSERFAVELMSDQEPGLRARLLGIFSSASPPGIAFTLSSTMEFAGTPRVGLVRIP
jgi:hypothetical protein